MSMSIWPNVDVIQRGNFTADEAERLRAHCESRLKAVPDLMDPDIFVCGPCEYIEAGRTLAILSAYCEINTHVFHPELRFIAFYGRPDDPLLPCNAVASKAPDDVAVDTYLIKVNLDGVSLLYHELTSIVGGLDTDARKLLPGTDAGGEKPSPIDCCLRFALTFLFFHELAHVARGHLDLGVKQDDVRRTVELDADEFAARVLGLVVASHTRTLTQWSNLAWYFAALLGAFAVFRVFSQAGDPTSSYHSPIVRLSQLAACLEPNVGSGRAGRLLVALALSRMGQDEELIPKRRSSRELDVRNDMDDLREITLPLLKELRLQGKLRGWLA